MSVLNKSQILLASDLATETLNVPEWGGDVVVRELCGADRDAFEIAVYQSKTDDEKANLRNIRARAAVLSVVDENGTRIFSDADIDALGQKSAAALDRVYSVFLRINKMSKADQADLEKK